MTSGMKRVPDKLPVAHVTTMLEEAGLLQRTAQNCLAAGDALGASLLVGQARRRAEDAATYALPSGMHLSVRAMSRALDQQSMTSNAIPRRGS